MRTSDAERHKAADFLRDACGDGRLSTHELEERLDALFAGTTVADIAVLVRDLPGGGAVIPRLTPRRRPAPDGAAPLPVRRRRRVSPAVPLGVRAPRARRSAVSCSRRSRRSSPSSSPPSC